MLMAQASAFNAVPISTAYDSLGPEGLTHALNETEVRSMFTNGDLLGTLAKIISKCETVRLIVYDGKADEKVKAEIEKTREGLKVVHLDEVYDLGREKPVECIKAKRDDIYCCMYTSGSSEFWTALSELKADNPAGTPKGVLLSHGNVVSASAYHVFLVIIELTIQSDPFGPCCTTFSSRTTHISLSFPWLTFSNSSSRTPSSSRECQLVTVESRPLPMRVSGSARVI